jgi:hypothetical protein
MYAIITDGSISKYVNHPKPLVIGDVQYPARIFSAWTASELAAIGIIQVTFDDSNKKDEKWYINTNQTYTYDASAGTVTATYGTATAKAHADTLWTSQDKTDGKIPDGEDVGDVATRGLKYNLIQTIKKQAAGILQDTDWYIVRKADAGTAVPSTITNHRAAVRTKAAEMETAITNAANTPALETLYTYTEQEDGSVTRPLGELPRLES